MKQVFSGISVGLLAGIAVMFLLFKKEILNRQQKSLERAMQPKLIYPLRVKLYRFELNKDSLAIFNEWMKWHEKEHTAIIETLEREKMYFESIFRDTVRQKDVIYWLAIDGEGGAPVSNSPLKIDSVHNAYAKSCLKRGSRSELQTEFYLVPAFIKKAIAINQADTVKN